MSIKYYREIEGDLKEAFLIIQEYYPIKESSNYNTVFIKSTNLGLQIKRENEIFKVYYSDLRYALRGVFKLLSSTNYTNYEEKTHLENFHIMYDCSRNAVLNLSSLKSLITKAALLGYTAVSLYMEDIYELEAYPAFGYLRGKYNKKELKEINDFGKKLGVEILASIQTLGHLGQIFHYRYFDDVKDTTSNLLVDEEKTYLLIEEMIKTISECFDSRKIMLGMDEAHSLGRGKYLEKYGYQEQSEIFLRHLQRVVEIAKKYNYFNPIIWSDMFIKMFSKTKTYYDKDVVIPQEFIERIPEITLGYWDYDNTDLDLLFKMIEIHQSFKKPLYLVTGLQTYFTPAYRHWQSKKVLDTFDTLCKKKQISNLILTVWNDDGSYCDPFTSQLGIFYLAEKVYAKYVEKEKFTCLVNLDYDFIDLIGHLDYKGYHLDEDKTYQSFATVFYDDPLYGVGYNNERRKSSSSAKNTISHYQTLMTKLNKLPDDKAVYQRAKILGKLCYYKIKTRFNLLEGYFDKNQEMIKEVILDYHKIIDFLKDYDESFVLMWNKHYKTYGIEVMIGRFSSQIRRYYYVIDYLEKYLNGEINKIAELEEYQSLLKPIRIKDLYANLANITIVR